MTEREPEPDSSASSPSDSADSTEPESGDLLEPTPLVSNATGAWKTIWIARDGPEANLAVDWLREQGISARTDFENTAVLGAWAGMGPGTFTNVQVPGSEVEQARKLLAEMEAKRAQSRLLRGPKCLQCGAVGPARATPVGRYVGIGFLIISIVTAWAETSMCIPAATIGVLLLLWPMTPKWRCGACGQTWSAPDESGDDDAEDDQPPAEAAKQAITPPPTPASDDQTPP
jgi:hypothetical protein